MTKTIKLDHVTKIEGHAKLHIVIDEGKVKTVDLNIFEGSRFFEGIMKNKKFNDMPDIASRICGICSVVHAVTSLRAVEKSLGIELSEQSKLLRETLNAAGHIQSHVLHLYFMVLPDYYGFPNALQMAGEHKKEFRTALKLKKLANKVVRAIGGRDVHPIAARIGGFTRVPSKEQLDELLPGLREALEDAKYTVDLFANLEYPDFKVDKKLFALVSKHCYWCYDNELACYCGGEIPVTDYESHFEEYFKEGSTSEFAYEKGKSYMVGALPRILVNRKFLPEEMQAYIGICEKNKMNPYYNNLAQAIEIYAAIIKCISTIENHELKDEPLPRITPKKGSAVGAFEAPRGIVFHKYEFDDDGVSTFVNITTPTTQNLQNIEDSIRALLPDILDRPEEDIKLEIEKLIRAFDPCISCATHFLELKWENLS